MFASNVRIRCFAEEPLHFALLLPMSAIWDGGQRIAGAAALAVEKVNADSALLPGRVLQYSWADSGCSAQQGLKAMGQLLMGVRRIDAVIGPGCSPACEATSHLLGGQGIPQVSYSCTSPTLSIKTQGQFELFSRTVAPETSKGPALIALIEYYKWSKAVMLTSTVSVHFVTGLELTRQLQETNITVLRPSAFESSLFNSRVLSEIKRSAIRIMILIAYGDDTRTVASSAALEGMNSVGWSWIIPEESIPVPQMLGWLYMRPAFPPKGMQTFAEQVSDYTKSHFNITVTADSVDLTFSVALHDAVMLYAHAATKMLAEGGDLVNGTAMTAAVRSTTFEGVGGSTVALNQQGDRIESWEVMNLVKRGAGVMDSVSVGTYNTIRQYMVCDRAVVWPGNTTEVPGDFLAGTFCCIHCPLWGAAGGGGGGA